MVVAMALSLARNAYASITSSPSAINHALDTRRRRWLCDERKCCVVAYYLLGLSSDIKGKLLVPKPVRTGLVRSLVSSKARKRTPNSNHFEFPEKLLVPPTNHQLPDYWLIDRRTLKILSHLSVCLQTTTYVSISMDRRIELFTVASIWREERYAARMMTRLEALTRGIDNVAGEPVCKK